MRGRANETCHGFSKLVWTKDSVLSLTVAKKLTFGTVWVNSHFALANKRPWGGSKGSECGGDLARIAIEDFTRTKRVGANHGS